MKMSHRVVWAAVVGWLTVWMGATAVAQDDGRQEVWALYLSSPHCPFCQVVEEDVLEPLEEEYGPALNVETVDTTTQRGQAVLEEVWDHYQVSSQRRGVPTMVVGEEVLVGGGEIPERLPTLIAEGQAHGGVDALSLASLEEWRQWRQEHVADDDRRNGLWDRFRADMPGNAVSLGLLVIFLMLAMAMVPKRAWQQRLAHRSTDLWRVAVAVAGLGISLYLTYGEVTQEDMVCGPIGQCNIVQQSDMAMLFGVIPLALLGVVAYGALLVVYGLRWRRSPLVEGRGAALALAIAGPGFLFSIVLTFWQPFVLGATCAWCLGSAITMSASCVMAVGPGRRQWRQWLTSDGA